MRLDFVTAVCEEFFQAIEPVVNPEFLSPQECWNPVVEVLGSDFEPAVFSRMPTAQIDQLKSAFAEYFECDDITARQISTAVSRIVARCPIEN